MITEENSPTIASTSVPRREPVAWRIGEKRDRGWKEWGERREREREREREERRDITFYLFLFLLLFPLLLFLPIHSPLAHVRHPGRDVL